MKNLRVTEGLYLSQGKITELNNFNNIYFLLGNMNSDLMIVPRYGFGSIPRIPMTTFFGMNIHNSQLFWDEPHAMR